MYKYFLLRYRGIHPSFHFYKQSLFFYKWLRKSFAGIVTLRKFEIILGMERPWQCSLIFKFHELVRSESQTKYSSSGSQDFHKRREKFSPLWICRLCTEFIPYLSLNPRFINLTMVWPDYIKYRRTFVKEISPLKLFTWWKYSMITSNISHL